MPVVPCLIRVLCCRRLWRQKGKFKLVVNLDKREKTNGTADNIWSPSLTPQASMARDGKVANPKHIEDKNLFVNFPLFGIYFCEVANPKQFTYTALF